MGKTIKLTAQQLENVLNTTVVNCNSVYGTLYKYIRLSYVLEMLKNKEITFVSPELWNDPFETKYLKTDYSAIGYIRPEQIYCFCARTDNANEEASWNIYSNSQEDPLIRISLRTFHFLEYLKNYSDQHNCKIYYSRVDYGLKAKDIAELYKADNEFHDRYFNDFTEEKYIQVMSLKRQAFKYENEVRIFLVSKDGKPIGNNGLLKIPIDYNLFIRYTFAPLGRIKGDNITSMLKKDFYLAKVDIAKNKIKEYDSNTPFYKSTLYNETPCIKEITE